MIYKEISPGDFDDILKLYEKYLNYGRGVVNNLTEVMNYPDTFGYKCVEQTSNGEKMIGMFILENTLCFTGGQTNFSQQIKEDAGGMAVWTATALAVETEYRGNGISTKLIDMGLDGLSKRGVHHLALDMWVYPDGSIPSLRFLTHSKSYKCYGLLKGFYKELYKKEIYCPVCGAHCNCDAKLYVIEF